jgi:hypothetical protein
MLPPSQPDLPTDRVVIGTFTYAKLPMVRGLQAAGDLLGDSDIGVPQEILGTGAIC